VLSCVTNAVLQVESYRPSDAVLAATLNRGVGVPLGLSNPLRLGVRLHYRVVRDVNGWWRAQTAAYHFELTDETETEILAYHWHPEGRSPVTWPHLHLGQAIGQLSRVATRAHLPTGFIALEDLIELAITEFGVAPRRLDWEAVLRRTRPAPEQP